MRRLSLSTKLFAAALPLVLAVGALLALTVRSDLDEVAEAERGADLGAVWTPLVEGLNSIETELANMPAKPDESTTGGIAEVDPEQAAQLTAMRRATDQVLTRLGDEVGDLGAAEAARKHITQARTEISGARRAIDMASLAPGMSTDIDPLEAYDSALRQLVSVGHLLPAESGDAQLGRELLAVVKLAEARVASDAVIAHVQKFQSDESNASPLATAQVRYAEIESVMNEFSAIAPEEWAQQFRQSDFTTALSQFRFQLDSARRAAEAGAGAQFDLTGFEALSDRSLALQQQITGSIVERASAQANETRQTVFVRLLIALGAVLIASLTAWLLTRSVTRRVKTVSRRANQVANEQLPALVDAIRDPRGKTVLPTIEPVDTRGSDELAELAHAFNSMQATLVDVANEQVEVLRRGVSEIFVTMARRNRSLIDRQLAMLDEFEAEVDDPEVLSNYYQLDHMATRMRRNSESLLVLANAEPKRRRVKATEIDDVVRAAIGEVEDYRRIEVETLENLQVRGNVVADVSHLLAELLDNATSFSPPDSVVRVGGRRAGDSYMLRIVDGGVGISPDRLFELNELLREPPIVGLSVEPTLGMSVVSLLGSRHGVIVTLSQGNPGTTVDVLLPSSMFGPIDIPGPDAIGPASLPRLAAEATAVPQQGLMATTDLAIDPTPATGTPFDRELEPVAAAEPTAFERTVEPDTTPSWTTMSLDLAGLRAEPSRAAEAALVDPTPIASAGLFADIPGLVDDDFESAPLGGSSAASFAESFAAGRDRHRRDRHRRDRHGRDRHGRAARHFGCRPDPRPPHPRSDLLAARGRRAAGAALVRLAADAFCGGVLAGTACPGSQARVVAGVCVGGRVRPSAGTAVDGRRPRPPAGQRRRRPPGIDRQAAGTEPGGRVADPHAEPRPRRRLRPHGAPHRTVGDARHAGRPDLEPERPAGCTCCLRFTSQRRRLAADPLARNDSLDSGFVRRARQHHPIEARPRGAP